jgi:hypothetical protein
MKLATFNARAETVATKPMFRSAFKRNRCHISAKLADMAPGKAGRRTIVPHEPIACGERGADCGPEQRRQADHVQADQH